MLFDVGRRYPRYYIHRHKLQQRPEGFTAQGPAEMHYLLHRVNECTLGAEPSYHTGPNHTGVDASYINKLIYDTNPHGTADNHFSGTPVINLGGELGIGLSITNRRDRFPEGLKPYLHHGKTKPGDKRAKAMRFEKPIVAIQQVEANEEENKPAYTKTLVSFQSTGATNIQGVNNLPSVNLYVSTKERGAGANKRTWGIEQNEARQTYLNTYYAVDNIDHMVANAQVRYISWKYYHAAILHAVAMGVTAAYDMYKECCEGGLDPLWAVPEKERRGFREFRLLLSEMMLQYNPKNNKLPGDQRFRLWTGRRRKRSRQSVEEQSVSTAVLPEGMTVENFKRAKTGTRFTPPRLCGELKHIKTHLASLEKQSWSSPCEVCGKKCCWKCTECGKFVCLFGDGRKWNGAPCALTMHCDTFFGLSRSDYSNVLGRNKTNWSAPSIATIARNVTRVETIKREIEDDEW